MQRMRVTRRECRGGTLAAWAPPLLLIAGLLFILCMVDVPGGPARHDGECSIEEAVVAVATPAPTPRIVAIDGVADLDIIVSSRWGWIAVSPTASLPDHRRTPQQPCAPPLG